MRCSVEQRNNARGDVHIIRQKLTSAVPSVLVNCTTTVVTAESSVVMSVMSVMSVWSESYPLSRSEPREDRALLLSPFEGEASVESLSLPSVIWVSEVEVVDAAAARLLDDLLGGRDGTANVPPASSLLLSSTGGDDSDDASDDAEFFDRLDTDGGSPRSLVTRRAFMRLLLPLD